MRRRRFLTAPLLLAPQPLLATWSPIATSGARAAAYAGVTPGTALHFPRDHGSHPDHRLEWWYVTGWLRTDEGRDFGVQVTFFRHRTSFGEGNPSRFAPRQLLFAHAALAEATYGRLRHDQRAARAGFGLAQASETTTDVAIGAWTLALVDERYRARIAAREFALDLTFAPSRPPLLQGEGGYSRKGPAPGQASYYYSRPQLSVTGMVTVGGKRAAVNGSAWLDHEWSSELMAAGAVGWDWVGLNLADGGALMAFRMRDRGGNAVWASGSHQTPDGSVRVLAPADVRFVAREWWRSPRTGIEYPVTMEVRAGDLAFALRPLLADQELDSRASTGILYWEGAVRAFDGAREAGRGYLELTGYGAPLRL